ncbi:MAG: DUF6572 domain-containing protein [Cyanobacteria bacterium J06627_28]
MSIEQKDKVDFIGINKETGYVSLAISDHLDWSDTQLHLQLLQSKINAYLSFIESEEIYESYPEARGRSFKIQVYVQYLPNEAGSDFFEKVTQHLGNAGYAFQVKPIC